MRKHHRRSLESFTRRLVPGAKSLRAGRLRRPRGLSARSSLGRGVEQLEARWTLSANPFLTVSADQFVDEGSPLTLPNIGSFTDIVEGGAGGDAIGLDPDDFAALGAFDPATNVVINTDTLQITGGFTGTGVVESADAGDGAYDIAVFVFSDFELDAGRTITATGSRPLAILSQSDLDVFGTIDVSAFNGDVSTPADTFNGERWAGAGGGFGGLGSNVNSPQHGLPAAGAPANSAGTWANSNIPAANKGGGTGGGHGGDGGMGEVFGGSNAGPVGLAFLNLADGARGGSGGGSAGVGFFGGSGFLAGGGGGGGGIELGANGTITVGATGQVLADGGDGADGIAILHVGSGGGGAGGGIMVHATNVSQHGLLSVKGGNAGAGNADRSGGGGGGGTILLVHNSSGTFDNAGGTQAVNGGTPPFGGALGGTAGADGLWVVVSETPSTPIIETFDYVIDWGDDSIDSTGAATIDVPGVNVGDVVQGSFDGSHTYADDGVYIVTVTINDNNGGSDTETLTVTVANVAPALTISGAASVDEGATYTLSLASLDPGDDTIANWTINWGDEVEVVSGNPASVDHVYADGPASYTITATATDEDGTFASNDVAVTVDNVAPTLTISGASDVNEGSTYTLSLASFDPGDDTIMSWTIDWGDSIEIVAGATTSVDHVYADGDANFTISATATDEDGTFSSNALLVTVHNVAPTLTISGASDVNEGSTYTLNLASMDPGLDAIASWTINWGDVVEIVTGNPASVDHVYGDGPNAYSVSATATDDDGTFASNSISVTVHNVAPTITSVTNDAGVVGDKGVSQTVTLTAFFTDPGFADVHTATFDWGDGNITAGSVTVLAGDDQAVGTHSYAEAGAYDVKITIDDGDGGVDVIYTTTFVTGVALHGGVLQIVGTAEKDKVEVIKHSSTTIKVYHDLGAAPAGNVSFPIGDVADIEMYLGDGNDFGYVSYNLTKDATLYGGSGDDTLIGGSGNDVLIGGTGYDLLLGMQGADLLIGGEQSDLMFGDGGGDIFVGGGTTLDITGTMIADSAPLQAKLSALDAVMSAWTSGDTYANRRDAVSALLAGAIFDDDDLDLMSGGGGQDLFYVGDNGCLRDIILCRLGSESVIELPEI